MEQKNNGDFLIENGALLKYVGSEENVVIPEGVKHISPYAFYGCKHVTSIVTPLNLVSIARGAFLGCENLRQIIMPGRVYRRAKEDGVFENLESVYFRFYASSGDEEIDDYRYSTEVEQPVPQPPSERPEDALSSGGEERLEDRENGRGESGEESDSDDWKEDDDSLKERMAAIVPVSHESLSEEERRKISEYEDFIIEGSTVVKYKGSKTRAVIPDFITHIGDNAFSNSSVEEVEIPSSVVSIGKAAFAWCENIARISLPENLRIIDEDAFADCSALASVEIPDSVTYIGASAFHACSSLASVRLPAVGTVGRRTFDFCVKLTKVTVPEGVEELSDGAFSHCEALEKVSLPLSLRRINSWAFADCYCLESVSLPEGLEKIGDVAFVNCTKLRKIQIPYSVGTLGRQAFAGCTDLGWARVPHGLDGQVKHNKVFYKLKKIVVEFI